MHKMSKLKNKCSGYCHLPEGYSFKQLYAKRQCSAFVPKLMFVCQLTIGDYAAFVSVRGAFSSWYDLLGGWTMYTAPWARRRDLGALAAACQGMQRAPPAQLLDHTVRAVLEGDLHQVRTPHPA